MKTKKPGASTGHGTGTLIARDLHAILEDERNQKRAKLGARRERSFRRDAAKLGREAAKQMVKRSLPVVAIQAAARLAARLALNVLGREEEVSDGAR